MDEATRQEAIQAFCALTSAGPTHADHYLAANNWNVEAAINMYLEDQHDDTADPDHEPEDAEEEEEPGSTPTGGRTLGGGPIPAPPSGSAPRQPTSGSSRRARGGMMTLGDMQRSGGGHGHDNDEEDENENEQDLFAGGEKSGLAVQNPSNPRDYIDQIMRRARDNIPRPGGDDERPTTHFMGRGVTLGGDDAESRVIEDTGADRQRPPPRAHRTLRIWRNGFSVDDGPLRDSNDPANQRILEMIMHGHAPLDILDVERGQEVDLEVDNRQGEDYIAPKKKYKPFSGAGQRLGSPAPGLTGPTTAPPQPAGAASSGPSGSAAPAVSIDNSQPTVNLQIRLLDGTRLSSRFNTTHTVGDVYDFVDRAVPAQQSYVLMTTFPSKDLSDKAAVLGDMAEFKRGGVVVQKRL